MVCIERMLVSKWLWICNTREVADLESDAMVAKLRIRRAKGIARGGAWPQSINALDLGVIVVIGVECWMEAWLKNVFEKKSSLRRQR